MDITLRPVTQAELDDFRRATGIAFGNIGGGDDDFAWGPGLDVERSLAGFDGDQIVATAAALSFQSDRPGACAGPDRRGDHGGRPPHAPTPGTARADDGRATRRRRRPVRAARRAHRERDRDLRTVRVRPRHVLELLVAPHRGHDVRAGRARPAGSSGSSIPPPPSRSFLRSTTRRAAARRRGDPQRPVVRAHVRQPARRQAPALVHRGARIRRRARRRLRPLPRQGRLAGRDRRQHRRGRRPVRARSRGRDRRSGSSSSTSTSSRPCGASIGRWTNRCGGASPPPAASRSTR